MNQGSIGQHGLKGAVVYIQMSIQLRELYPTFKEDTQW